MDQLLLLTACECCRWRRASVGCDLLLTVFLYIWGNCFDFLLFCYFVLLFGFCCYQIMPTLFAVSSIILHSGYPAVPCSLVFGIEFRCPHGHIAHSAPTTLLIYFCLRLVCAAVVVVAAASFDLNNLPERKHALTHFAHLWILCFLFVCFHFRFTYCCCCLLVVAAIIKQLLLLPFAGIPVLSAWLHFSYAHNRLSAPPFTHKFLSSALSHQRSAT